jgi:serine phosphatase RsbU (regulator of sigma subunit)
MARIRGTAAVAAHRPGESPTPVDVRPPAPLRAVVGLACVLGPFLVAELPVIGFGDEQAVGWLAVGPLVASLVLGLRGTAVAGASAVAAGALLMVNDPGGNSRGTWLRLAVVAALAGFALVNCRLRERREARLRQVSEVARVTQEAILRTVPARAGTWTFAARYRSATPSAAVGGDLLEVIVLSKGRVRVIIGDVRGSGLPAVHLAAATLAAFREASLREDVSLPEVARLVDRAVGVLAADEDFVSAVFLELDSAGWVQVVNCGHPPPLRWACATDAVSSLSSSAHSTPLGLSPTCQPDTFSTAPGDRLLLLTDGLLEVRNRHGEILSPAVVAAALAADDPEQVVDTVVAAAVQHAGGHIADDISVLAAALEPAREQPAVDGKAPTTDRARSPERALGRAPGGPAPSEPAAGTSQPSH